MNGVIFEKDSGVKPIKHWLPFNEIEEGALQQARNLASLPFIFKHVALMPDCHQGYGMPIGGVIATRNVVIPNAVGVDIGCGMCAVKTPWKTHEIPRNEILRIMAEIRKRIPLGKNSHNSPQIDAMVKLMNGRTGYDLGEISFRRYEASMTQLGTMGGGNHFIEIQKDKEENIWVMVHSGSRNLGKRIADYYNNIAIKNNKIWHTQIPTEYQLAFLPFGTEYAQNYLREMNFAVEYAFANRALMMERIKESFDIIMSWKTIDLSSMINIAHNYAQMENHFGENVLVHRKGATLARTGTIGIIPGSPGTPSYIVNGLGNPDSFMSCSHGAGRLMSRTKAQNELSLNEQIKILDDQEIIHGIRHERDLDEAPGAYKDINSVMYNQEDLVKVVTKLMPLAVIKG